MEAIDPDPHDPGRDDREAEWRKIMRVAVVGSTGSGKTTIARCLSTRLGLPHVELDALHWEPNWSEAPNSVFRQRTAAALAGNEWVVDGNYSVVRDLVWPRAQLLVWLDLPLAAIFWQLTRRIVRRVVAREELWGTGNRESLKTHLLTKDSLYWWAVKTHGRRRREFREALRMSDYAHLRVVHLCSSREMASWLARVPQLPSAESAPADVSGGAPT